MRCQSPNSTTTHVSYGICTAQGHSGSRQKASDFEKKGENEQAQIGDASKRCCCRCVDRLRVEARPAGKLGTLSKGSP